MRDRNQKLAGRRSASGDGAEDFRNDHHGGKRLFHASGRGQAAKNRGRQENGETQNATDRAEMRSRPAGIDIGQKMKLGAQQEQGEQQAAQDR
jgi:hypothetical protein